MLTCGSVPLSGDMSREELSSLLLNYLGTAADIIDFLSILSEPNIVKTGPYLYAVLVTWTFSLLQVRVCLLRGHTAASCRCV